MVHHKMKQPIAPVRELCVHALQLADYVLDANVLSDIFVLRNKALAVKGLINQCYGDLPITNTKAPVEEDDVSDLL
jgi:hypothetical protein